MPNIRRQHKTCKYYNLLVYLHNMGNVTSMTCGASAYLPPDSANSSISWIIFSKGGNVSWSMSITSARQQHWMCLYLFDMRKVLLWGATMTQISLCIHSLIRVSGAYLQNQWAVNPEYFNEQRMFWSVWIYRLIQTFTVAFNINTISPCYLSFVFLNVYQ